MRQSPPLSESDKGLAGTVRRNRSALGRLRVSLASASMTSSGSRPVRSAHHDAEAAAGTCNARDLSPPEFRSVHTHATSRAQRVINEIGFISGHGSTDARRGSGDGAKAAHIGGRPVVVLQGLLLM